MTRPDEQLRGGNRRVGALLNAYYRIEGGSGADDAALAATACDGLDAQGFDARQHFDETVASGHLGELVSQRRDLDLEIQTLDGDMQSMVYKNYTKFTEAAGVIRQMKFCLEGMEPDFQLLEVAIGRVSESQRRVEDGVGDHLGQIDLLMKRQLLCRKIEVLFALPGTLKHCLDRGEYGSAVEAYCNCSDFLRQYRHVPSFKKVLEDVEHQMTQIGSALGQRLRSPYLAVDEAVHSSVTLLDMNKDQTWVISEYLQGRRAFLQSSLHHCFSPEPLDLFLRRKATAEADPQQQDLHTPESIALSSACWRINDTYIPPLSDVVDGFNRLQDGREATEEERAMLPAFVQERLQELFDRLLRFVEERRVPIRVLVSCMHSVRDAMRRLHGLMPVLVAELTSGFLLRVASGSTRMVFLDASASLVTELVALHGRCKGLQESAASGPSANAGLDEVLEQISRTEQTLLMGTFSALTTCQPLHAMLGLDRPSCQRLVSELGGLLSTLYLAFSEACLRFVGRDPPDPRLFDESLAGAERAESASGPLEELGALDWSGLFGLALVRIGRHLETRALAKVWAVAAELFAEGSSSSSRAPPPGVLRATRGAAQAVITHYVMVAGQRLANFFRNSIQNKNWMTVREPRKPSVLIETVILKEVHAFDAQLARILGDPKRGRPAERRPLARFKDEMQLEIERMVAKKLQVFAPVPFNRNGAIVGILRIAFKALFEYIREEMFAKFGVQQIQVDCAFLADAARDFVEAEDASLLDSLLDEALNCASMRCEGLVLLEPAVVQELVAGRKDQRGAEQLS